MKDSERVEGTVKWFNSAKGYGFIGSRKGDVFVHHSEIKMQGYRTLQNGSRVSYVVRHGHKGSYAVEVTPIADKLHFVANAG